ncbi:MAG: hypothetical protein Q8K75_00775 [Chlamydiales bacterium]|nr:hypothetical protein [Chlamydiales bacterium]
MERLLSAEQVPLWSMMPTPDRQYSPKDLNPQLARTAALLGICADAMEAIKNRQMQMTDALVGESACHIRATMFALYVMTGLSAELDSYIPKIREAQAVVSKIKLPLWGEMMVDGKKKRVTLPPASIVEQLESNSVDTYVPRRVLLVALAYLLTLTKVPDPRYVVGDHTIREPLQKLGFSKDVADRTIKLAKKTLAEMSVEFVQQAAELCTEEEALALRPFLAAEYVKNDALPCFAYSDIMLRTLRQAGLPIMMQVTRHRSLDEPAVDRLNMVYQATPNGYVVADINKDWANQVGWIVQAYCVGDNLVSQEEHAGRLRNFDELFLACVAEHEQYPSGAEEVLPMDPRRETYKNIAIMQGLSRNSNHTCVIYHIFCDNLAEHL